jgi:hypothetical protein
MLAMRMFRWFGTVALLTGLLIPQATSAQELTLRAVYNALSGIMAQSGSRQMPGCTPSMASMWT